MDFTSGSRTDTDTMDDISGSRTYTKNDGCHLWIKNLHWARWMSLVDQELTLTRWMSLVDQELTLNTMDVTSGSWTYTKHDGCH